MTTHADITQHPNWDRQVELEENMRTLGIERFVSVVQKNNDRGTASKAGAARRLLPNTVEAVNTVILAFLEEANSGKPGRRHVAVKHLAKLPTEVLAAITSRTMIDVLVMEPSLSRVAHLVGRACLDEINARHFKAEEPTFYKKMLERAKKQQLAVRQVSHLLVPAKLDGTITQENWSLKEIHLTGLKLVELFIQSTGMVEHVNLRRNNRQMSILKPRAAILDWMVEENKRMEWMYPTYMPTVVPPRDWTTPYDGGYHTSHVMHRELVKVNGNKDHLRLLEEAEMPEVYGAVNALQSTAWKINKPVYDVMQTLFESSSDLGTLPSPDSLELPTKPLFLESDRHKDDWTPQELLQWQVWKKETHRVYQINAKMMGQRFQFLRMMWVANKYKEEEEMYFPHQLDWRGRAYPMPLYLHPQGNDLQRGLLTFAASVPIADKEDERWLAIHGAGLWGVDKVSLEERHQWVLDNSDAIVAAGQDPYSNKFWTTADKIWSALAFCMEWASYKAHGYGYESNLPVQMDGTCNGLQNFSAMLLDEIGGRAVNLIPSPQPQDIYAEVAALVNHQIARDIHSNDKLTAILAQGWSGHVNRSVTKRPVMTLAYGARRFGFVQQVDADTVSPWRDSGSSYPFFTTNAELIASCIPEPKKGEEKAKWGGGEYDLGNKASLYMGNLIWDSVGQVVIAARQAMDWIQDVAKATKDLESGFKWTTPTGFVALQAYHMEDLRVINTTFDKVRYQTAYRERTKEINSRKQAAGIAPNWVHSLDASHLMKTINACKEAGIQSFSMIHDSYGTHAGNAWAMASILRSEFVTMYTDHDVLQEFRDEIASQLGCSEALPSVPLKGNLDLEAVSRSPFFFA